MAIEKRSDSAGKPAYRVRISVTNPASGKRQNNTIGTYRTKKDAEKAERDALTQQERGSLLDPKLATISQLLDTWLSTKVGNISPNSIHDYETAARLHLMPAIGAVRVQKLTPARLQSEYSKWQDAGMSPRLVHRCHVVLSQALSQAVKFGMIYHNIATDVTKPKLSHGKPSVWTPSEVSSFLQVAIADGMSPLWHLLALEGMRRGEALGLRWQDVNWERGAVHISQTVAPDKSNRGAAIIQNSTKTNSSSRTVKLSRQTLEMLTEHRDRQRFIRQSAGDSWQDNDLIVCTALGTPVNPNNVTRSYNSLVIKAGVQRIRVHDLRHTAATLLLRAGVPAKIVSERLGHASVSITMDLYSHVLPDMQDMAANAMSEMMDRVTGTDTP